jgi:S1-C subfamily serine protease
MRSAHLASALYSFLVAVICNAANISAAEARAQSSESAAPVTNTDAAAAPGSIPTNVANAVVKVFSTMRYPDPSRPWSKQAPTEPTASGVIIEGKRILTNAHAVLRSSRHRPRARPLWNCAVR